MSKITPSNRTADLGNDPVGRLLVRLALPTITAQIVNLLYNIVDRIYIGRIPLEGKLALTGMGVTFPVITLISAFISVFIIAQAARKSDCISAFPVPCSIHIFNAGFHIMKKLGTIKEAVHL